MPTDQLRFIFIGGTLRGLQLLKQLCKDDYIPQYALLLKQDDHEELNVLPQLEELCKAEGIGYRSGKFWNKELDDPQLSGKYDLAIVCGWRTILPPELALRFQHGLIAAHDSLLPKYRGFAPLNWAIINGEKETGVTLFQINDGEVDSGPYFLKKKVDIEPIDLAIDVYHKIISATVEGYLELFNLLKKNELQLHQQDETKATYTCKRLPEDGKVDFTQPWQVVWNKIRALSPPYPVAYCSYDGKHYDIAKAAPGEHRHRVYAGSVPGRCINLTPDSIEVLCGTGSITIYEWKEKKDEQYHNIREDINKLSITLH